MKRIGAFLLLSVFLFAGANAVFATPARDTVREVRVEVPVIKEVIKEVPVIQEVIKEVPVVKEVDTQALIILHTNDHHGEILPTADGQGGLAERAAYIKGIRDLGVNVLLLDAGDINTGTALSNMFDAEPDIKAYNMMGYDAVAFGNHEFDGSAAKGLTQLAEAQFPMVSSNIKTADGNFLGGHQYLIKKYDGFTVGIFGITTLRTLEIASPDKSLTFINEITAARDVVNILRNQEKVDIVIGLTHMGTVQESPDHITSQMLAAAVPGIDILIDGHSHTYMDKPVFVGNTGIVSANEWGKYVGQGALLIRDKKIVDFSWAPVAIRADTDVAAMLAPYIEKANASLKEVIGNATDTFTFGNRLTRYQETSLGNAICDANVAYFQMVYNQKLDFAFHNGGNIRAELPKGPITRENVLTILPFENYLYIVSLKGSDLQELFNFIATIPQGAGGFPQFSSEVRYTLDVPNKKITNLTIGGAPIDPNRTYRFCTNDYILGGGDGYTVMSKATDQFNTSLLLSYVVMEAVQYLQNVTPYTDGRMVVIGGVTP
ncbi:MAG: 5'-nucleotidase C-terminal domain-containing protein [Treponema sp.]|nr:5'-nucleotidase C-terminal domain-containing protein [Treponema sp.]